MELKFDEQDLIPAIVQDNRTGQVLMVAYMNREALRLTQETGQAWFWSRERQALWRKGETSGNTMQVRIVLVDCDGDAILLSVDPAGPACHTGEQSCFFRSLEGNAASAQAPEPIGPGILHEVFTVILDRQRVRPEGSYVAGLFAAGLDRIAQKVGEEAIEAVLAAKGDSAEALTAEVADLWFHSLVLLAARGLSPEAVWRELARRRKPSSR
ncbi:MAG: bifunctional phosphoribosyl-AMP cyclohydrolase/phosphoribosyl-ATP diphosphatase HisIE [Chloroflexi bacterium]|nr:bifunctional phosphoribosyl-AMP cyclohydrolase/phosphoribosyl-ATP diphosphatase HisIE [Chloroflexota bacterium]